MVVQALVLVWRQEQVVQVVVAAAAVYIVAVDDAVIAAIYRNSSTLLATPEAATILRLVRAAIATFAVLRPIAQWHRPITVVAEVVAVLAVVRACKLARRGFNAKSIYDHSIEVFI